MNMRWVSYVIAATSLGSSPVASQARPINASLLSSVRPQAVICRAGRSLAFRPVHVQPDEPRHLGSAPDATAQRLDQAGLDREF